MKGMESQESESSTDHGILRESKCRGAPREGTPVACSKMGTNPGRRAAVPTVGCAPSAWGRVWAEEPLLGDQILFSIYQVPHVIILEQ